MLVETGYAVVKLVEREVPVLRIDGLELAAVDGDEALGEQFLAVAETVELPERPLNGLLVVLAEVGYRAEVGGEPVQQPHDLDVDAALTGQLARGTHPVVVAVHIKLHQVARVVTRGARVSGGEPLEAQLLHVQTVDERIHQAHWSVLPDIVVYAVGEKHPLSSVFTFLVCHILYLLFTGTKIQKK